MVKITRVYTKKGDKGSTQISKTRRASKNSLRVEVLGLFDELNSFLGWARLSVNKNKFVEVKNHLSNIQNILFDLGAYICKEGIDSKLKEYIRSAVDILERSIDSMNLSLPAINSFVLPGGEESSARLHIARTICRRAECKLVAIEEEIDVSTIIPYINRLSDWLFVAARHILYAEKLHEELWVPFVPEA